MAAEERGERYWLDRLREGTLIYLGKIPRGGYRWMDDMKPAELNRLTKPGILLDRRTEKEVSPSDGPWLVGPEPLGIEYDAQPSRVFRRYRGDPGLHHAFGKLEGSEPSILKFANRYGELGCGVMVAPVKGGGVCYGESLQMWQHEINQMAMLLAVWDLVQQNNRHELARYVCWEKDPLQVQMWLAVRKGELWPEPVRRARQEKSLRPIDWFESIAHEAMGAEWLVLQRWGYGELQGPAGYFVHRNVNKRLRGHTNLQILPFLRGEEKLVLMPDSLLAAIYVLFALELVGRTTRECRFCKEPFRPSRRDQVYCTTSCRKKASYHRLAGEAGIV